MYMLEFWTGVGAMRQGWGCQGGWGGMENRNWGMGKIENVRCVLLNFNMCLSNSNHLGVVSVFDFSDYFRMPVIFVVCL